MWINRIVYLRNVIEGSDVWISKTISIFSTIIVNNFKEISEILFFANVSKGKIFSWMSNLSSAEKVVSGETCIFTLNIFSPSYYMQTRAAIVKVSNTCSSALSRWGCQENNGFCQSFLLKRIIFDSLKNRHILGWV